MTAGGGVAGTDSEVEAPQRDLLQQHIRMATALVIVPSAVARMAPTRRFWCSHLGEASSAYLLL